MKTAMDIKSTNSICERCRKKETVGVRFIYDNDDDEKCLGYEKLCSDCFDSAMKTEGE